MQNSILFKNTKISFSDVGKGTAVVLLHGFLENTTMWKDIIPELSKRNRIIAIDLLGHGKTACLGYIHSMETMAEAVEAVLNHLRLRRFIVIGHSMGGYVALAFAEKNPQKIKGLCLMNSTSNDDDEERKKLRSRANKMIQTNFESMVKISVSNLFGQSNLERFKSEISFVKKEALKTPLQGYIAANEGMRIRKNRNRVLQNNDFKKLLIIGEKDPVLDYKTSLKEAKETNTEFVVFPDGHMSHVENKEKLNATLVDFVKGC
ncbi:pimeloyl-ACP methyl ester carboxylesterase [Lutibacter sp. Hel_I_33_5]|uniref:alpha/beta fold hydrolase n=1 Tax=Lutibacter sp. Hel_I_33_5 TaxID=1566289 RepID=UPI0011A31419|nr:alpha/beta hydrolase [Lutibacter sp. Hel_I_33_5]TVZ56440.1 pimeloyl-ACP methyl ester carboxylesterase [Lutibacter sp. Hel_I_33_5]